MQLKPMPLLDLLCGMDTATNVIVYAWPNWPGTPKMIPTDINLVFFHFKGYASDPIRGKNFDEFNVVRGTSDDGKLTLKFRQRSLTFEEFQRLTLSKLKCQKISFWLNAIHLRISESEGILPGIYAVTPGSWEERLHQENSKKIKEIASEIICEFHDKLWLAESVTELENIYNAAISKWVI